jgi:hypothetical protein
MPIRQQLSCSFSAEDSSADTVAHAEERDAVEDRHGEDDDGVADFFKEALVVIHCAYSLQVEVEGVKRCFQFRITVMSRPPKVRQ